MNVIVLSDKQVRQYDPTRTLTIRNQFALDVRRRFKAIGRSVQTKIIRGDSLQLQALGRANPIKVAEFIGWFRGQLEEHLLTEPINPRLLWDYELPWVRVYFAAAAARGTQRAEMELKKAGYSVPTWSLGRVVGNTAGRDRVSGAVVMMKSWIASATSRLVDKVRYILSRPGLSSVFDANSLVQKAIGFASSEMEMTARTEISRIHHLSLIDSYRDSRVGGVFVLAEFMTAGDDRVCGQCASLEGRIFTLDEIEELIPVHPRCRCMALPVDVSEDLPF